MTLIHLDPSAVLLASSDPEVPDEQLVPGAQAAIGRLLDAGFKVVMLVPDDDAPPAIAGVTREGAAPLHLDADAWYVTGIPRPDLDLPRGGTTILVGPRPAAGTVPLPRFDVEARDMPAAAMEILARVAMA